MVSKSNIKYGFLLIITGILFFDAAKAGYLDWRMGKIAGVVPV